MSEPEHFIFCLQILRLKWSKKQEWEDKIFPLIVIGSSLRLFSVIVWVLRSGCWDRIWCTGYLWRINACEGEGAEVKLQCRPTETWPEPQEALACLWPIRDVQFWAEMVELLYSSSSITGCIDRLSKCMFLDGWLFIAEVDPEGADRWKLSTHRCPRGTSLCLPYSLFL